jgi:hypothetical protein
MKIFYDLTTPTFFYQGNQLPPDSLIHPVFRVSQLKSFTPDHSLVYSHLPHTPTFYITEIVLEKILFRHLVKKGMWL